MPPAVPAALALALLLFLAARQAPPGTGRGIVAAGGQAVLLGAALRVGGARPGSGSGCPADAVIAAGLLLVGAAGAAVGPAGAAARLGVPLWLAWLAVRGRLGGLAPAPIAPGPLLAGAALGALLGLHLMVSASRTLGYQAVLDEPGRWLAGVAYDAGANVPATAGFVFGVLHDRTQRRLSGPAAAALTVGALVARYLADPLLPVTPEVVTGAVFYIAILGGVGAWLAWWSGSPAPGALALLVFFAAWRLLGTP